MPSRRRFLPVNPRVEMQTHIRQFLLLLRLDAKAWNVGVGEAGGVLQLLHAADLRHGLIFGLLLGLRLRHLHFMLLVWWDTGGSDALGRRGSPLSYYCDKDFSNYFRSCPAQFACYSTF